MDAPVADGFMQGTAITKGLSFKPETSTGFIYTGPDIERPKAAKWVGAKSAEISLAGAMLHIPEGAMPTPRVVSISALRNVDIPALNQGMVNVTKGYRGFRFLPHGNRFAKAVLLGMAYDETKIPKGYTANDVVTFYFDTKANQWLPLRRDSVDVVNKKIISTTTHFTDMINAVLEVPESPETEAYTPNAMSGIAMAGSTSEIVLIAPPTANQTGSAALAYPIKLPAGRNGMEPQLAIQYNSEGENNWLGLGWDLATPAVSIETRWGVPRYNPTLETETYIADGEQLNPVAHRSDPVVRTGDKQFHTRVEKDFQKIIRHGDNPKNYWWEVTEKNGTRRFFGGNPGNGIDATAILTDASGNIAYWALTEARDLNENFIRYRYSKVLDAGTAGGSPGSNLYLASISYTGNGNTEGKYSVVFTRDRELGEEKRKDVTISAKLGFKQVTADRLRKIAVQFNGQNIRSYELNYAEGAFYKTLLQNIREFDAAGALFTTHSLEYYNDIQGAGGVYQPLSGPEEWNPQDDQVKGSFLNPIPAFNDNASALGGNKSIGGGFGVAVTIGPDDDDLALKTNTAGVTFGFNFSTNEGMLALVDINGDGLVDKVYKKGGQLFYRANQSAKDNNVAFGPIQNITGIDNFNRGESFAVSVGLESNFVVYAGFDYTHTEDITSVYLSDVNGDQLVDIVKDGTVYFNHIDNNGNPVFTTSSGDTPSPLKAASAIDAALVENDPQALEKAIDDNPLHDVVKVWVAPFDGTVSIAAPVSLVRDNSPEAQSYTAADGVRVAIQHKSVELWSADIAANDFTPKTPVGVDALSVQKGDRLYFRVQSKFNGAYDQVLWTPQITYTNQSPGLNDANALPLYQFTSDKDFLVSAVFSTGASIGGTIHIQGDFIKPVTSDDVTVQVLKKSGAVFTTLLQETYSWDQVVTRPVSIDENVLKGDDLFFRVSSKTNIDWTALQWNPFVYYTASTDPRIPRVIDDNGKALIHFSPTVDFQAFTRTLQPSLPWMAPASKTFSIQAKPVLTTNVENGEIVFSVKKEKQLVAKQVIPVTSGVLGASPILNLVFNSGDKVFFEYHTTNTKLASAFVSADVQTDAGQNDPKTVQGGLHTMDESFLFGPMYRHWGQFAYNGNRTRANQPIIESDLVLDPTFTTPKPPIDLSTAKSADEMQQMYAAAGGNQPKEDKFIYLVPNNESKTWIGFDNMTYVNKNTISSSRMGKDDLLPVNPIVHPDPGSGSGAVGIKRVSKTDNVSFGIGIGPDQNLGGSLSTGTTKFVYDYTDMNGDGYPDILSNSKIQYTLPNGGLEATANPYSFGDPSLSSHFSAGFSLGGKLPNSSAPNASSTPKGAKAQRAESQSAVSPGISVQFNVNTDNMAFAFMDINGDGLPDRVYTDGQVELNLGYSFLPKEQWGYTGLSDGTAISYGGGLSINIEDYSIAAGVSLSRTENETKRTLQDLNGDGLLDYIAGVSPLMVRINTGTGFGPPIPWTGADGVNKGVATGEAIDVAFTIGISILPILPVVKLCINPSINIGQGADRTKIQFADIDGDGFPDFLQSDVDSKLTVSRSTMKRTNKLKKVSRPLGGSFTLDYKRVGNTYDLPNTVWTLSSVDVFDGVPGDGTDRTNSTFEYQNGRYDRNEREFYGFGHVITRHRDTEKGDAVYRVVKAEYLNDNFYEKGLVKAEVLEDAAGNKFTEKKYSYELKDINTGATLPNTIRQSDDGAAFPALVATEQLFYEGQAVAGKTTSTTFTYDVLGNLKGSIDFGDPGPEDDLSTAISYHSVPGRYIMNIPSSVTISGGGQVYRQRASTIDNNTGNLTEMKLFLQSGDVAKFNMSYDALGNLTSFTRPQNAAGQRLNYAYQYDTEVQTYITKTTDSYGYASGASYDVRFGKLLSATDLNGQQTQYTLDNAGRISTIRGPLEIAANQPFTMSFEYHPEAVVPWALTKHFDPAHPDNFIETASFSDGLGRDVPTKKDFALFVGPQMADQEVMLVSGANTFDAFGRTVTQYYPITEPKGTTGVQNPNTDDIAPAQMTYDVMDRLLTTSLPDQAVEKMEYGFGTDRNGVTQFKTRSVDANGISTERFFNVRGLLTATKQQYRQGSDVWTSYSYNPVNELTKVTDDQGNPITMVYDQFGRKTGDLHPDAGTTNYTYDLAGNLINKTTANLQSGGTGIKYTYDQERLVKIAYPQNPQNNVTITYGAAGEAFFRAGRIKKQQDASGTQEFFYNPLGAMVKDVRVITVPDALSQTFTTEWTYDTWNRLTDMIYPDGETLTYHYNLGGMLQNMSGVKGGTTYNYLPQLGYDKFEKKVYMRYGNGTEMTYAFEPERRRLAQITARTAGGRFMMNNTYSYDKENNLLNIVNNAPVPPNNLMGGKSAYQFTYDDLYRLTNTSGNFTTSSHVNRFTQVMTYNSVSGITSKNQVHERKGTADLGWVLQNQTSYRYDYNYNAGNTPHAPIHIGAEAFTYDANGNQSSMQHDVSAQNRQIEWDEENRITTVSDNGDLFRYTYDASGIRVLKSNGNGQTVAINGTQVAKTSGLGNYTIYVNPYEVVRSGGFTKHIYIEGQRIVSKLGVSDPKKQETFQFYYHPDNIGNSAFITDAAGEVYQHLEYFPFGETFIDEHSNQWRTPYLYNGKELDDETGLYYYGTRYYDPRTSVWENVDPAWKKPDQINKSPYAYVGNNPVTYIDPFGNDRFYDEDGGFRGEYGEGNNIRIANWISITNGNKIRNKGGGDEAYYAALSEGSRLGFNSADEAAINWGHTYNPQSIAQGLEYGSSIYRYKTAQGDEFYAYSLPNKGEKAGVFLSELEIEGKPISLVADIHSHGNFLVGYWSNIHSSTDKKNNFEKQVPGYVATPSGKLRKYIPNQKHWWSGKVKVVTKALPFDRHYRLLK
nr:SpvB/TcaC N-terminal domain-containing protein [Flavisolibacter nicotianae]